MVAAAAATSAARCSAWLSARSSAADHDIHNPPCAPILPEDGDGDHQQENMHAVQESNARCGSRRARREKRCRTNGSPTNSSSMRIAQTPSIGASTRIRPGQSVAKGRVLDHVEAPGRPRSRRRGDPDKAAFHGMKAGQLRRPMRRGYRRKTTTVAMNTPRSDHHAEHMQGARKQQFIHGLTPGGMSVLILAVPPCTDRRRVCRRMKAQCRPCVRVPAQQR